MKAMKAVKAGCYTRQQPSLLSLPSLVTRSSVMTCPVLVFLVIGNAAKSHEDTMLCKKLAECCSGHTFHSSRLDQLSDRSAPQPIGIGSHEFDHSQHAVGNLAFLKLFFARALDEVPSAIPSRQLQLPEFNIASVIVSVASSTPRDARFSTQMLFALPVIPLDPDTVFMMSSSATLRVW